MNVLSTGSLLALIAAATREMDWIDRQFDLPAVVANDRAVILGDYKIDLAEGYSRLVDEFDQRQRDDPGGMSYDEYIAALRSPL